MCLKIITFSVIVIFCLTDDLWLIQDSTGMKLWKKRWFVLSDMCLFYYRGEDTQTHMHVNHVYLSHLFTNIKMWKIFTVYIRGLYFWVVYLPNVVINIQQRAKVLHTCYPSHSIIFIPSLWWNNVLLILIRSVSTPLFSSAFISKNQSMVVKTANVVMASNFNTLT